MLTYRNPDNSTGNPTARYLYDQYDRVSDITDVFGTTAGDTGHTTSFSYNLRGQLTVTTLPVDPVDGSRRTLKNYYNSDGTIYATENQLYQSTQYTYDDYRRLRSMTPPVRGWNDTGSYTTHYYYDANGTGEDYRYTDSSVTYVTLPSGKRTKTVYDDNRRTQTVTVGFGTGDDATTSYGYDNAGNLTTVTNPLNHNNTTTAYDERNRPSSVSMFSQTTAFMYDNSGRSKTITRPDGQLITNVNFDAMNRVTLKTVSRSNSSNMVTQYFYYTPADGANAPVGLLKTFEDPKIYGSGEVHTYEWDLMGRKTKLTYPRPTPGVTAKYEQWTYDTAGRLYTFRNRNAKTQTFTYDGLNRMTGFSWNDGLTPSVTFGYDVASRMTSVNNANANISRGYFYDNRPRFETESILLTGGVSKTVNYTYDADGNRANITYPESFGYGYTYTGRNQLQAVNNVATYVYDTRGNLTGRTLLANSTSSDYTYDTHDRVTWIHHYLDSTRTFNYGYDSMSNNRTSARRLGSTLGDVGDAFSYDLADQVTAVQVNVATPQNWTQPLSQNVIYDSNGNRTWFTPPGSNQQYATNNLNQYTTINSIPLTYQADTNLASYNGSTYSYDAQGRLTSATVTGAATSFAYDGLNRQVSRTVNGGQPVFNIWDGWDLIEEYQAANNGAATAVYLYGATGLIGGTANGQFYYYYQDGSGSTSHVANGTGQLQEWYRYDLQGIPVFYNASDQQISASAFGVRHLFTGQQWYSDISLYDLRNRFYSPDIGRFLQPDPIGFRGDRTNLYRYCRNNPVTRWDPFGLQDAVNRRIDGRDVPSSEGNVEPVIVDAPFDDNPADHPSFDPMPGFGPLGGPGGGDIGGLNGRTFEYHLPPRNSNANRQQQPPPQNPQSLGFDIYHPTTTAEFVIAGNIIEGGDTTDTTPAIDPIDLLSAGIAGLLRSSISSVAARATTAELSVIRYTRAGETFIRYESGNPAFSRVTASGGVRAGTYAAPVSDGVVPLELRASTYNLPSPNILRSDAIILRPPAGIPVIGPRSVVGGLGDEVIFPFGY